MNEVIEESLRRIEIDFKEIDYYLDLAKQNKRQSQEYSLKQIKESCLYIKLYCMAILKVIEVNNE
jgi:hypothetical protein